MKLGRPKEFDRREALEKAMEAFWAKGYEGTSVSDLLEAMGIHRGSMYDTFGDKRSLFLEAASPITGSAGWRAKRVMCSRSSTSTTI